MRKDIGARQAKTRAGFCKYGLTITITHICITTYCNSIQSTIKEILPLINISAVLLCTGESLPLWTVVFSYGDDVRLVWYQPIATYMWAVQLSHTCKRTTRSWLVPPQHFFSPQVLRNTDFAGF